MPMFWFAEMVILVLAMQHGWFPTGGRQTVGVPTTLWDQHSSPGTAVLVSLDFIAAWSRYLRSSMLEVLQQDYLRTARAKGVSRVGIRASGTRSATP